MCSCTQNNHRKRSRNVHSAGFIVASLQSMHSQMKQKYTKIPPEAPIKRRRCGINVMNPNVTVTPTSLSMWLGLIIKACLKLKVWFYVVRVCVCAGRVSHLNDDLDNWARLMSPGMRTNTCVVSVSIAGMIPFTLKAAAQPPPRPFQRSPVGGVWPPIRPYVGPSSPKPAAISAAGLSTPPHTKKGVVDQFFFFCELLFLFF